MDYIQGMVADASDKPEQSQEGAGCFLCEAAAVRVPSDEAKQCLVLLRDGRGVVMLNRYPYTNGHLMVAPLGHIGDLTDLTSSQRGDLIELTAIAETALKTAVNAQGVNIGVNIGRCAGAGLPGHLHVHIVPRWNGDTNFMRTVGCVRVIPEALEQSYARLAQSLKEEA